MMRKSSFPLMENLHKFLFVLFCRSLFESKLLTTSITIVSVFSSKIKRIRKVALKIHERLLLNEWKSLRDATHSTHIVTLILPYLHYSSLIWYKFYSIPITITKGNKKGTQRTTRVNFFPLSLHKCLSLFSYLFSLLIYSYECIMISFNGTPMLP